MTRSSRNRLIALAASIFVLVTVPLFAHRDLITTVILVRHAEKTDEGRDPMLSPQGSERAALLARILSEQKISAIFSTPFHRTRDTATPLSKAAGVAIVEIEPNETHAAELASSIMKEHAGETVVVVGHSNTVPQIIEALGVAGAPAIGHDGYDDLFVVVVGGQESRLIHLKYGDASSGADVLHEMTEGQ